MHTPSEHSSRRRATSGRASLSTLAAHLGLSPAAISRVLNNAPAARSIPRATQDRIFEAARLLDYRPNVLARSLRRGHSMTLGVLVPEIAEGFTALVLAGLEQGLREAGYVHLMISHHHRAEVIQRSVTMLSERAVDGLIAIDTAISGDISLPLVAVSCPETHQGATSIRLNHQRAAELALDHLVELGHKEIAVIKGQPFSSDTEVRFRAIQTGAAVRGLCIHPELTAQMQEDTPTHEPGYHAAHRLLASGHSFTALFAFNDISAIGAIRALREAGRQVPGDVSVVGFDDIQSAAFQNPSLTTVRQPLRSMGLLAAETILKRISQLQLEEATTSIQVDPELVIRESTGPVSQLTPRT